MVAQIVHKSLDPELAPILLEIHERALKFKRHHPPPDYLDILRQLARQNLEGFIELVGTLRFLDPHLCSQVPAPPGQMSGSAEEHQGRTEEGRRLHEKVGVSSTIGPVITSEERTIFRTGWRPAILAGWCCVFSAIGSFLFGYDTGIISSAIAQPDFVAHFGGSHLSDAATGGVVSSFTAGAIIGTATVSFVSDRFGRRTAIFAGSIFACLGGALQGGANVLATMVLGRCCAGIGIGFMSATIPNYCAEIAPAGIRALLGGMQQWMIGLGIVTSQWIGFGSSKVRGPFSWRLPLSLQVAPALLLACGIFFLPESPRNLAERGKTSEAHEVLERLHLNRTGSNRDLIELELQQIKDVIKVERHAATFTSWRQLYRHPSLRKRVLLACSIQLFTQTSGTNVIGYYGPRIYSALGYSVTGSLFIVGLYGALAQIFNTICMAFVDRIGRRKLLIPSMIGMGAALCVEATLAKYYDPVATANTNALRASVAMNFVFALFFTSVGVISWIYPSEIFPSAIRAKGTSVSTFTNWAVNLIIAQCSPIALTRMGHRYFYFFTAFNWVAAVLVYMFYPETLGHSLEEVLEVFGDVRIDANEIGVADRIRQDARSSPSDHKSGT